MSTPPPYPRDKDKLLREVDASIKIKDIKRDYRLRDEVEVKWWESALVLLLFVSALGLVASVIFFFKNAGAEGQRVLLKLIFFWLIFFAFSMVLALEVVLMKINALRRLHSISAKSLEAMRDDLKRLRDDAGRSVQDEGEQGAKAPED